ncbi:MAG: pyrroline-5-carboxylate reductase [Sphingomonadaceae bacterium]|nr:pyrroline-5-carboxylate reductase [Sphingomonadaceae bacterium]
MGDRPVWLIGCGNMAGAMLQGWLAAGRSPANFHVIDPGDPDLPGGVDRADGPSESGFGNSVVQLGFKPHMLADIAPDLSGAVGAETIVTSILAGVEIATLRAAFPEARAIVRVMPNMPVALGLGAVGVLGEPDREAATQEIAELLAPLGRIEPLSTEAAINAVTVLAGSGPAFLYRFADSLAGAGAAIGLDAEQSLRLALATIQGAAAMAVEADENPAELAERVASPGGTTRAGLDVLDAGDALSKLLEETLAAAIGRAEEMAAETRG